MKIDEMQAGRELDALIAKKLMGWTAFQVTQDGGMILVEPREGFKDLEWTGYTLDAIHGFVGEIRTRGRDDGLIGLSTSGRLWQPSTDIAAAWQVVEKITDEHKPFPRFCIWWTNQLSWMAEFQMTEDDVHTPRVSANTAPLAICRAALKAVTG